MAHKFRSPPKRQNPEARALSCPSLKPRRVPDRRRRAQARDAQRILRQLD